jgi:hypothetical protein
MCSVKGTLRHLLGVKQEVRQGEMSHLVSQPNEEELYVGGRRVPLEKAYSIIM